MDFIEEATIDKDTFRELFKFKDVRGRTRKDVTWMNRRKKSEKA